MREDGRDDFQAWLWGEILLIGLLGSSLALFVMRHDLQTKVSLPELGLVLHTVIAFAGAIIALLAGIRYAVEGRRIELFLCAGFLVASVSIVAFSIVPVLNGEPVHGPEAWAAVVGRLLGWGLIAAAPFVRGRSGPKALANTIVAACVLLALAWLALRSWASGLPALDPSSDTPSLLVGALSALALLNLLALVGFGKRFHERREDLDRWLALGSTLMLFASLHYMFTPVLAPSSVSRGEHVVQRRE